MMDFRFLASVPVFSGIKEEEIEVMLSCLNARKKKFDRGAFLYRAGEQIRELGLVLGGSVSVESDDLWGNHTMLDRVCRGRVFAEAYACAPGEVLMVSVVALEPSEVLFLDMHNILQVCSSSCEYHQKLIRNLVMILAQKNLNLSRRSLHTAPKSIRARVLSYLSFQAKQQGNLEFEIPLNRQQLADYLNVDRSALSAELGRMQKEGLIRFCRNHFTVTGKAEEMPFC